MQSITISVGRLELRAIELWVLQCLNNIDPQTYWYWHLASHKNIVNTQNASQHYVHFQIPFSHHQHPSYRADAAWKYLNDLYALIDLITAPSQPGHGFRTHLACFGLQTIPLKSFEASTITRQGIFDLNKYDNLALLFSEAMCEAISRQCKGYLGNIWG